MRDLSSSPIGSLGPADHRRGAEDRPLVIIYAEFSCPDCAIAAARLKAADAQVCFRHFALKSRSPRAVQLAIAAEAAACQGAFWQFHDSLFEDQGHQDDPHLWQRCRLLGLDLDRFEADRRDPLLAERVATDVNGALRAGASGAPSFAVDGLLLSELPDGGI